jgi:Cu/Ag efflux pump CusA
VGARLARSFHRPRREPENLQQGALILASFPEVTEVVDQIGRPDDGTDWTGFFNTEYNVNLKPKESGVRSFIRTRTT